MPRLPAHLDDLDAWLASAEAAEDAAGELLFDESDDAFGLGLFGEPWEPTQEEDG